MSDLSDERVRYLAGNRDEIPLVQALARQVLALRERVAGLEGATRADEHRLNAAATKVWGENVHGCDAPDWLAEEIIGLRTEVATLTRQRDGLEAVAREAIEALKGAPICCGQEFCGCVRDDRAADALRARLAAITGESP